ncbi:hypothetical protein HMN09_01279400 [Mycena chlorophos]|uniref:Uncharacterized protein n=1 Tax=Mycena chlorophos TaxID=658473 RepID=A0A8H6VUX1_MYCCL|nr:hypothetical protein HMN09_01279400 [Mycena chlorophos]
MFYTHRRALVFPTSSPNNNNNNSILKGSPICQSEPLVVQITSSTVGGTDAEKRGSRTSSVDFVATHTIHVHSEDWESGANRAGTEDRGLSSNPPPTPALDASSRVSGVAQDTRAPNRLLCGGVSILMDIHIDDVARQNTLESTAKCNLLMPTISFEPAQVISRLLKDPTAVFLCESSSPSHEPESEPTYIVLTPAEEGWDDFTSRCSNQPNPQWQPYLPVPPTNYTFSPFGTTIPNTEGETERPEPITVFSPSRLAAFTAQLALQTVEQALFTQRHMAQAVAHDACNAGASVREYYDHPQILAKLDHLCEYAWTDPAAHLLESWRRCLLVTIHESDCPFAAPHIVVSHSLPNAPWDCEAVVPPVQDTEMLEVPVWVYQQQKHEDEQLEDEDEFMAQEAEMVEDEFVEPESASESDEAGTPSPPSWIPELRQKLETLLEDDEEDEARHPVPTLRQTASRRPWLDEDDDFIPPIRVTRLSCVRIELSCSLPTIDEGPEPAYQPNCRPPLWSSQSWSPAQYLAELLVVAAGQLEAAEVDEEDTEEDDSEEYGFGTGYRPSCNIFIDTDDTPQPSPISPTAAAAEELEPPRGKANVPAGTVDWFDLPEDDLGPIEWATG